MDWIQKFECFLTNESKSKNTVLTYTLNIREYLKWFNETYDLEFTKLYRENLLEYKSYLLNTKKYRGKPLNGKTVNNKLSSLVAFNIFLVEEKYQEDIVLKKNDLIKLQADFVNPCKINKQQVEQFRQRILEAGDKRMYALVTLLTFTGLRISEALSIKQSDYSLEAKELIVRKGKGEKQRILYLNSKTVNALRAYLKERRSEGEYLFVSRQSDNWNRTVVNRLFKKYSTDVQITPHMLRHYFATNCIQSGEYSINEICYLCGHRSVHTLMTYLNPSVAEMKAKMERL